MSAAGVSPATSNRYTRRTHRYDLAVPLDITVLRSGVPDCIPGRAVNVCEGGLGAVVAGDLHSGDSVGVEFRLPSTASQFHAKAVVRYEARLQFGLEFQSLSQQQRDMIRYWGLRNEDAVHTEGTAPGRQFCQLASEIWKAQASALPNILDRLGGLWSGLRLGVLAMVLGVE